MLVATRAATGLEGLTENAGRENDGPSKLQGMKLQDVKMMDQFAGHEIAGHENAGHENARHDNDGPKMTTGREMAGEKKYQFVNTFDSGVSEMKPAASHTVTVTSPKARQNAATDASSKSAMADAEENFWQATSTK